MAIHTDALAQIYARSVYALAEAAGGMPKIFEVGTELEEICELARSDRSFQEFLASPIIDRTKRAESLRRIFRDRITDLTFRFLLVINDKGRLGHLEPINAAYDQLVQTAHGRIEVDVYTATEIDEEQTAAITERIKAALGKEPVLHPYRQPSMLGGIKLRIGDQLIDGSVATRLRRLRQDLLVGGHAAVQARLGKIIDEGAS
ncbi:MAG: ATP synthase F1 subunit delta [Planctomycetes bacterium]|nr:ATP synthase F1 subunit delta [Planctomycetota bacterium]